MGIKLGVDTSGIKKGLDSIQSGGKRAIEKTMKDMANKSRGPAQITKGVKEIYGMSPRRIAQAYRGSEIVKAKGGKDVIYTYIDHMPTPYYFGMTPKTPTKRKQPPAASFFKGSKTEISPRAFLFPTKAGESGKYIAGINSDGKLMAVKSVSVPSMVSGEKANEAISRYLNETLKKRFDHHMEREMGK